MRIVRGLNAAYRHTIPLNEWDQERDGVPPLLSFCNTYRLKYSGALPTFHLILQPIEGF